MSWKASVEARSAIHLECEDRVMPASLPKEVRDSFARPIIEGVTGRDAARRLQVSTATGGRRGRQIWRNGAATVASVWPWFSRVVMPRAHRLTILVSTSGKHRRSLALGIGSKRSCGMPGSTLPLSVVIVFGLLPLRWFGSGFAPSGSASPCPSAKCSSSSTRNAGSASAQNSG